MNKELMQSTVKLLTDQIQALPDFEDGFADEDGYGSESLEEGGEEEGEEEEGEEVTRVRPCRKMIMTTHQTTRKSSRYSRSNRRRTIT